MATQTINQGVQTQAKWRNIVLWCLQVVLAIMFFIAGANKIAGDPTMVAMFETIGVGQWFRFVTGIMELSGALLLLAPRHSGLGALLISCVMTGAIITHLFVIGGNPALPIVLLVLAVITAYGRRDHFLDLLKDFNINWRP